VSDELSIHGAIAETTVPDLFRSIIRSSETAQVLLEGTDRTDTIYFNEGRIVFASSSDPDMGLAETLLRSGEISVAQYNSAMDRLVVSRRIGSLLIEMGFLKPEELSRAVERQASAIVLDAMAHRRGNYTIEFGHNFPDEMVTLPLSTERLVLDGVQRIEYWSLVLRGISRFDRLLEQTPNADRRTFQLELTEEESSVLTLIGEAQTVEQICARSYLSNFATCRTIWGLLAVNFVQDCVGESLDEKRVAEESEYELEDLVERYNTVFQRIFAMVFQKIGDHVYDFMDRVVLHLSPETLPYLSGMNMVNEGRVDFDQLLNNLIASGSIDQRQVVLNVLNELLYGWIYEVKSEFGAKAESEVVRIASEVKG
jgi:hypothetical protein